MIDLLIYDSTPSGIIAAIAAAQHGLKVMLVSEDRHPEGDLLALAGCSCHIGREGRDVYGKSLAGRRFPPAEIGQGDEALQGFDYRLCLTDNPDNQTPVHPPPDYDAGCYAFQAACWRHRAPVHVRQVLPLNPMPNRKTDSRTGEWTGGSGTWPGAGIAERRRMTAAHRAYSQGHLWFVKTDASVPGAIRDELEAWGLAADEFVDNGNWPYHLYVREARRLIGEYVMTQADVTHQRHKPDSIALGSFFLDVHAVRRVARPDAAGGYVPEGGLGSQPTRPYEIAYRSLLPRRAEADNLLASVCVSASHVAFSSMCMEPVLMMMGHAAGLAAGLYLSGDKPLHDLDLDDLRHRLAAEGQLLDAAQFNDWWPRPPLTLPARTGVSGRGERVSVVTKRNRRSVTFKRGNNPAGHTSSNCFVDFRHRPNPLWPTSARGRSGPRRADVGHMADGSVLSHPKNLMELVTSRGPVET